MTLSNEAALNKDKHTALAPMQHRHFATIATIIREMPDHEIHNDGTEIVYTPSEIAEYFADRLAETNPRFDRERFLAACNE